MARQIRLFLEDTPQHIMLQAIDGVELFKERSDYEYFNTIFLDGINKYLIALHAYIFTPEHIEFLASPQKEDSLAKFMQSLGRRYVRYYNNKYERNGTLWSGRYKASIVQANRYLFDVMCYIESQHTKKKDAPCSIHKNLFDKKDELISYHKLYKEFGFTQNERIKQYQSICNEKQDRSVMEFIQNRLETQSITGSDEYIANLEKLVGHTLQKKSRGRPKKTQERKKMYQNLQVLDKTKHKELKVKPLSDLAFGKTMGFIPTVGAEVEQIAKSFPIVFSGDESPMLVTIVSLGGESLGINNEGKWITPYVPMFLRKYPFSIAATKEDSDQRVVLIDEDSPNISTTEGSPLFDENGEQTQTLEHAIKFLNTNMQQEMITKKITQEIAKTGILDEREIAVGEGEEKKVLVNKFFVVDREKLNALSDDILADWVRRGIMTMIDAHIKSLSHIETLFKIAQQRQS